MKTYTYNNEYIDLGEIGQHECVITAINTAAFDEKPRLAIMRAIAMVRLQGHPLQPLDVTSVVREDLTWKERVQRDYEEMLAHVEERPA